MRKCPKCKENYKDYPAISRADNSTKICPLCGIAEAIVQFNNPNVKIKSNKITTIEKKFRKRINDIVIGLMEEFNSK